MVLLWTKRVVKLSFEWLFSSHIICFVSIYSYISLIVKEAILLIKTQSLLFPWTNQYLAMRVKIIAKGNNWECDRTWINACNFWFNYWSRPFLLITLSEYAHHLLKGHRYCNKYNLFGDTKMRQKSIMIRYWRLWQ